MVKLARATDKNDPFKIVCNTRTRLYFIFFFCTENFKLLYYIPYFYIILFEYTRSVLHMTVVHNYLVTCCNFYFIDICVETDINYIYRSTY